MKKRLFLFQLILFITLGLTVWAILRVWQIMNLLEIEPFQLKWFVLWGVLSIFGILTLIALGLTCSQKNIKWFSELSDKIQPSSPVKILLFILFGLTLIAYPWLVQFSPVRGMLAENPGSPSSFVLQQGRDLLLVDPLTPTTIKSTILHHGAKLQATSLHWLLICIICLTAAGILRLVYRKLTFGSSLVLVAIWAAVLYKISSFLTLISKYPFTLWEEGYRIYYASLVAANRIYGAKIPLSPIDFSLNLLNGIPFLFGDFPIWIHRLWYATLSVGLTILTTVLLSNRLGIKNRTLEWMFSGWLILYLLSEGGIHYHLLLCVVIILVGFSNKHFWRTLILVIAASIWAGMSRLNWYPVPGMLAALLFILEEPATGYRNLSAYLWKPVIWVLAGFMASLGTSLLVFRVLLSSQDLVAGYITSPLLWYRLLPNPTYPLGILLAIILISLPLWWICLTSPRERWHPVRIAALTAMIGILFAGGLVVSVKIGGGADLHNMDAYMIFMVITASYVLFNRYATDRITEVRRPAWIPALLAVAFPIWSAFVTIQPEISYEQDAVELQLQAIREIVEPAARQGEVLFLYQRPLLTFRQVDAPLVPEYENIYLMGMAMTNTNTYISQFQADLSHYRFRLIVSANQPPLPKGRLFSFGEENDAWYYAVTEPLLKDYELVAEIPEVHLEFYIPRTMPSE